MVLRFASSSRRAINVKVVEVMMTLRFFDQRNTHVRGSHLRLCLSHVNGFRRLRNNNNMWTNNIYVVTTNGAAVCVVVAPSYKCESCGSCDDFKIFRSTDQNLFPFSLRHCFASIHRHSQKCRCFAMIRQQWLLCGSERDHVLSHQVTMHGERRQAIYITWNGQRRHPLVDNVPPFWNKLDVFFGYRFLVALSLFCPIQLYHVYFVYIYFTVHVQN